MLAGIAVALGASLFWALANVSIQKSGRALGPVSALFWAQLFALPVFGGLSALLEPHTRLADPTTLLWTLVAGISGLFAYVPLFDALEKGSIAVVIPIASSWSVLSTAMGVARGQPLHAGQIVGTVLVIGGIVLVARASDRATENGAPTAKESIRPRLDHRRSVFGAALAAIGFGVMVPALGELEPRLGPMGAISASYVVDLALGIPLALAARVRFRRPRRGDWRWVMATGALETLGFACVNLAGRYAPLAATGPAASLSPAFTVAYAWLVLGERPGPVALAGGGLASLGIVLLGG